MSDWKMTMAAKHHVDQHVADHPVESLQRREPRQVEQHDDQQRADRHLNGASPLISFRNS